MFDEVALAYDQTIDWRTRLGRELPFITERLATPDSGSVIDIACGSGHHAVALARRGYRVIGIDSSLAMIRAAHVLAQSVVPTPQFILADMRDATLIAQGDIQMVLCIGNSLSLLPSLTDVEQLLYTLADMLSPHGRTVLQLLNFDVLRASPLSPLPMRVGAGRSGTPVVFARFFDHLPSEPVSTLVFLVAQRTGDHWQSSTVTQRVLNISPLWLVETLHDAGFGTVSCFADYSARPFIESSRTLVVDAVVDAE